VGCKRLVLCFLSELVFRPSNRFRWVFCQLDVLRHCLPPSVRRTLNELPESLDETYERVLKEIKKPNRELARRLLQCLVVAVRPLRVEELAEVLAVDFDDAEGIPKLDTGWRWEDQEQALLSSCSSLIAIEGARYSRIVQFSHFSVKEFLTSPRLGASSGDISCYHVDLKRAHTTMAQACLGVLLRLGDATENTIQQNFPLAQYAAEHWASHARFKNVSANLHRGMEYLFDPDKPHLFAWLRLHNIDNIGTTFYNFTTHNMLRGCPLYYASLYGLHDLARYLTARYPEHVNTRGGYHVTPLVAALSQEHFQTAEFLCRNGADPNVRGYFERTPLHAAAYSGNVQVVDNLIEYNADINAEDNTGSTPLHEASMGSKGRDVIRLLLNHGAGVNSRGVDGSTPLHRAVRWGRLEVARVLVEHGANVRVEDEAGRTPLRIASETGCGKMMELLREYGAK
jgi:hypothetical protein